MIEIKRPQITTEESEDGKITIELPPMTMNDRIE